MANAAMRRHRAKGMRRFFMAYSLFAAVAAASLSAAVFALPVDPQPMAGDLATRVEVMQAAAMQQALGMSDVKSAEFSALLERYKARQVALEERYRTAVAALEASVESASRQQLAESVRQVETAMDDLRKFSAEKWHATRMLLTLKQQARYLIYQAALQRALKRRLVEGLANSPAAGQ